MPKEEARLRARRLPIGAELQSAGVHFRIWAPAISRAEVVFEEGRALPLEAEGNGYWSVWAPKAKTGTRYRYRLGEDEALLPDPASRYQPEGPHGPSEVIDPDFPWTDRAWPGLRAKGQVVYELHLGTFTPEGNWEGARARLPHLRDLGVTCLELMPVACFPGAFNWGYDGVNLFAPYPGYGRPEEFKAFVDAAHAMGLGLILDVVYNHFGPDGNYLGRFSPAYFSRQGTEWGDGINFDGEDSGPVREFFTANAVYWISEYHLDGLRFDATQNILDTSDTHILAEIARAVRAAAGERSVYLTAENERQEPLMARPPEQGGYGMDAMWNDDFHHAARVALTGRREAYLSDYKGSPQEFVSAAKYGYLFQGQFYHWQRKRRGHSTRGLPPRAMTAFLENHDQVANTGLGDRLWRLAAAGNMRALTALLLLGPWTPLLFQGQEWASSAPFTYFADFESDLAQAVRKGRIDFMLQFPRSATAAMLDLLPDPGDPKVSAACKLDWSEPARPGHREWLSLHRDLLALRREDPVLAAQGEDGVHIDGAVLSEQAFVLRFLGPGGDDRLLLVNLGGDLRLKPAPEPLLAPPEGRWRELWSSEDPRYGGGGTPPVEGEDGWRIPAHAAVLLQAGADAALTT